VTLREAIREVESYLDGESQSGRIDEETTEAFDLILARAQLEADLDPMESAEDES